MGVVGGGAVAWRQFWGSMTPARLAQSAERKALNLVVVGSSPTVGDLLFAAQSQMHRRRWRSSTPAPREARTPDFEVNSLTL